MTFLGLVGLLYIGYRLLKEALEPKSGCHDIERMYRESRGMSQSELKKALKSGRWEL